MLRPNLREKVERKQDDQKNYFHGNRTTTFEPREIVMAKDYSRKNWRVAEVKEKLSPVVYNVETDD